jgi:hypothetical protein
MNSAASFLSLTRIFHTPGLEHQQNELFLVSPVWRTYGQNRKQWNTWQYLELCCTEAELCFKNMFCHAIYFRCVALFCTGFLNIFKWQLDWVFNSLLRNWTLIVQRSRFLEKLIVAYLYKIIYSFYDCRRLRGHAVALLVEALSYNFDSRWSLWNFSLNYSFRPLTDMSTKKDFLGDKDDRCVGLTTLPRSCTDCLEIWKPQPPGTLGAYPGLYRDSFTFTLSSWLWRFHGEAKGHHENSRQDIGYPRVDSNSVNTT